MQPGARHVTQHVGQDRDVPRDGHLLGRGRPAAQPQHGRHEAVVRLGALGQRRLLGVLDDRQPERARVGQRGPQDRRRPDRRPVVREADDARVGKLAERGELLPSPPDRDRTDARATRPATPTPRRQPRTPASTPGSSSAGVVFGIAQTVVKPPCAAAASPDATVSASSLPGSRRWAWRSMNPGATTTPSGPTPSASSPDSQVTVSRIPSIDDDLARALAARRWIDQPRPADLEIRPRTAHPAPVPAGPVPCVPASR